MDSSSAFTPEIDKQSESFERELRPRNFNEFLGQKSLLEPLEVMIKAAEKRKEPLEHVLLTGSPGLGKTSLGLALAEELQVPLKLTSGPALERAKDLVGILSQLEPHTLLFIDEIHRIPKNVEEYLYGAMERFELEFTLDQGVNARLLKLDIQPFTLIGATTREALLSAPFRSRFGHIARFQPYSTASLFQILKRNAARLNLEAERKALEKISEVSRGIPRISNRLLRRARDVAQCETNNILNQDAVNRMLELLNIDEHGMEETDRRLLNAIANVKGRPIGLKTLAVATEESEDTIEEVIEPWLIRQGLIAKTPQGRVLTEAGIAFLA